MGDTVSPGRRGLHAHLDGSVTQSLSSQAVWRLVASESKGLVVIYPDGRVSLDDRPIVEEGANITTRIDVGDDSYDLYRYTLLGVHGPAYGYIASLMTPGPQARRVAAQILFGPGAIGVEKVEPVRGTI